MYYFKVTSECPSISFGCGTPINDKTVGATSAKIPFSTFATLSETTTIGTGFKE